jgi:hypothetical protein
LTHGKDKGRPINVALLPGDEIEFHVKGTRQRYVVYLGHAFRLAQILTIEQEYNRKLQAFKERKAAGLRAIKPKRPMVPFSKIYFDAIKK